MIDWTAPLQFEDGFPAFVVARLSRSGKCRWENSGESQHSETYAELHDQGIRFFVATDRKAKSGGCVDEHGYPVRPWDTQFFPTLKRVVNADLSIKQASVEAMAANDLWGMF